MENNFGRIFGARRANRATNILLNNLATQTGKIPVMIYRGANIWHNTGYRLQASSYRLQGNNAPLIQNFVADWTDNIINSVRKSYKWNYSDKLIEDVIKKINWRFSR